MIIGSQTNSSLRVSPHHRLERIERPTAQLNGLNHGLLSLQQCTGRDRMRLGHVSLEFAGKFHNLVGKWAFGAAVGGVVC